MSVLIYLKIPVGNFKKLKCESSKKVPKLKLISQTDILCKKRIYNYEYFVRDQDS